MFITYSLHRLILQSELDHLEDFCHLWRLSVNQHQLLVGQDIFLLGSTWLPTGKVFWVKKISVSNFLVSCIQLCCKIMGYSFGFSFAVHFYHFQCPRGQKWPWLSLPYQGIWKVRTQLKVVCSVSLYFVSTPSPFHGKKRGEKRKSMQGFHLIFSNRRI